MLHIHLGSGCEIEDERGVTTQSTWWPIVMRWNVTDEDPTVDSRLRTNACKEWRVKYCVPGLHVIVSVDTLWKSKHGAWPWKDWNGWCQSWCNGMRRFRTPTVDSQNNRLYDLKFRHRGKQKTKQKRKFEEYKFFNRQSIPPVSRVSQKTTLS